MKKSAKKTKKNKDNQTLIIPDKFLGLLENPGEYRKKSDDYAVTFAIPLAYVKYIQSLMQKTRRVFVVYLQEVLSPEQAETLLQSQDSPIVKHTMPFAAHLRGEVSVEELARFLTPDEDSILMTARNIQILADKGVIIKAGHNKYDLEKSVRGYISALKKQAANRTGKLADKQVEALDIANAQKILRLKQDEEMLVMRAAVKLDLAAIVRAFSTRVGELESTLTNEVAEFAKTMHEKLSNGGVSDHELRVKAQEIVRAKVQDARKEMATIEKWE